MKQEIDGLWHVLALHAGSNAEAVSALEFFGVAPDDILAPVVVRRRPNPRGRAVCVHNGRRKRYVQPMRDVVTPLFPGYVFVRCAGPVACDVAEWAMKGRGALLRSKASLHAMAVSAAWIEALRDLCQRDSQGRMRIGESDVTAMRASADCDALRELLSTSQETTTVRMISGPFEGQVVEIEPVVKPDELTRALKELDEDGLVRVSFALFGSRREVVVPREQVRVSA